MLKFFRLPFATTGDKTAVPDAVDSNGNVSYSQGYGFDYQRQKTDPAAKNIERDKMNQILFDITTAIAEIQSQGAPDFITSALNGGTAYSYGQYAIVKYSGALYISLVAANTALPSDATKWALLPTPALLQQSAYMSANAAGTVDAITAAFTPAIAALPAAPGTLSVFVRATGANTSTTPTFKADALAAKTIVKGNNVPLLAGDIAGASHWLELQYDPTLDKWVLQNPTHGFGGTPAQFDNTTKTATTAFVQRALGSLQTVANYAVSSTIPNSGVGGAHLPTVAGTTLTLPQGSVVPPGSTITIHGNSWGCTVARQGSDTIALGSGGAVTSVTVGPFDRLTLVNVGPNWYAIGGETALGQSSAFAASRAANGYQKLPGGLIIQWGVGNTTPNTASGSPNFGYFGTAAVTFPIAFPSAVVNVLVTPQDSPATELGASWNSLTTTGVTLYMNNYQSGVNVNLNWLAIGY